MAQSLWAENLTGLPCDCASELWPQGMLAAHLHVIVGSGIEPIVQSREAIWLASARFTLCTVALEADLFSAIAPTVSKNSID